MPKCSYLKPNVEESYVLVLSYDKPIERDGYKAGTKEYSYGCTVKKLGRKDFNAEFDPNKPDELNVADQKADEEGGWIYGASEKVHGMIQQGNAGKNSRVCIYRQGTAKGSMYLVWVHNGSDWVNYKPFDNKPLPDLPGDNAKTETVYRATPREERDSANVLADCMIAVQQAWEAYLKEVGEDKALKVGITEAQFSSWVSTLYIGEQKNTIVKLEANKPAEKAVEEEQKSDEGDSSTTGYNEDVPF